MSLSFFYNKHSGSGEIHGNQMGGYLKAKLNPKTVNEDDVCVYIKHVPLDTVKAKSHYVSVIDGDTLIPRLQDRPELNVIAMSRTGEKLLTRKLKRNVLFIPEHHCNFENYKRTRKVVNTVGAIGCLKGFDHDLLKVKKRFEAMGMVFRWNGDYKTRQDVVEFYKKIDIQICWRPHIKGDHAQLHNPLKLANAGSFGIPTVSYPESNFITEFNDCFFPAFSIDELFDIVEMLRDDFDMYERMSTKVCRKSEEYHIERVSKLYGQLI